MRYLVAIAVSAALLGSPLLTTGSFAGDKGEKVAMEQLPAPVKTTVEKEAKGGTVADVVKETEKGKTFYEAKIVDKNGKERFVHVADSGKVLKRESAKTEAKEEAKDAKEEAKKK